MLTIDDVRAAARRLSGVANRTPVLTSRTLDARLGATVHLKAECFQRTGSFKFRGAYNALASLDEEQRRAGVVTYSSGNHAQALALAASLFGVPATIVTPHDVPASKVAAAGAYGAEIERYDRYTEDREAIAHRLAGEHGWTLIPPFDHWSVMAGQGTAALELFDHAGPLDTLVVCVGGGGLISGCSTVAKALGDTTVIGVEPEAGDDVKRSLREGRLVTIDTPQTIADGQQTNSAGERTLAVMQDRVDDIVLVTDAEIIDAMRFAFERLNIVLEPSGASALAAVMAGHIDVDGRRVGITLSGGNVGFERFSELLAR